MLSRKQAYKSLEKKFKHFIKTHDLNKTEEKIVLGVFIKDEEFIRPFDKAFTWYSEYYGRSYDFFYFLSLRWLMMLIKYSKLYQELYERDKAVKWLGEILGYSDKPHPLYKCGKDPLGIRHYNDFFYKQRDFYLNFLQKIDKKFGN